MNTDARHVSPPPQRRRPPRAKARRGITVLMVLALIATAMALSYAVVRSQATSARIQQNSDQRSLAQQAAITGVSVAMGKMSHLNWLGVDTMLSGSVDPNTRYQVTYTTGDPQLAPGHPEFFDYPFRVTLLSTGSSRDPANPASVSTHRVRAVVRLVPRQISDPPPSWSSILQHTVYQYTSGDFEVAFPARIQGSVRVQGELELCKSQPGDDASKKRLLADLNKMRLAGLPDHRPFDGPVNLPYGDTSWSERNLLTNQLGVTTVDIPTTSFPIASYRVNVGTYRLYPGGREYTAATLPSQIDNTVLSPDPLTNPLGVFFNSSNVDVGSNVTVQGLLATGGDLNLRGVNIRVEPVDLPPLDGASTPVQTPVVMAVNGFRVRGGASGAVRGFIAAFREVDYSIAPQDISFAVQGRVVTKDFTIERRSEWTLNDATWSLNLTAFLAQLDPLGLLGIKHFPEYMEGRGLRRIPVLTIAPEPTPLTHHWLDGAVPVYVPRPGDGGLKWELVDWVDSP